MNRKERRAARKVGGASVAADATETAARARTCHQAGRLDEAAALYRRAIRTDPDCADAQAGLGRLLLERDELDAAVAALRRALALRPVDPATGMNLVLALTFQGRRQEAASAYERALAADPRSSDLRRQLLDELASPSGRPIDVARAAVGFVKLNPAIAEAAAHAAATWPDAQPIGPDQIGAIAADPLLRLLLESCPIGDISLERLLTRLRASLLAMAGGDTAVDDELLALACALALQCFLNDYVYPETADETAAAHRMAACLAAALARREPVPAVRLAAIGAYRPLHELPGAEALLARSWPVPVARLLARQIAEPAEERRLRANMPVLTAIEDTTSLRVRQQYEQHPYPRWVNSTPAGRPTTLDAFIRAQFPRAPYRDVGRGDDIDILIAGCGTGQQSIDAARRFGAARILAVDLSLASLGHAVRQSRACGLGAIGYAQADIMNLPETGRRFDLIESGGVLHHLGDPLAGWYRLVSLLRSNGVMRLGLYSEAARRDIIAARAFIAARGLGDGADDIRRCRQELIGAADGTPLKAVTTWPDFFSTSECRDLLFHVMEHRLTLPAIAAFLDANRLVFLGFEIDGLTRRRYAERFPDDVAMTDLGNWHRFEQRNPATFTAMYQFWVQKRA